MSSRGARLSPLALIGLCQQVEVLLAVGGTIGQRTRRRRLDAWRKATLLRLRAALRRPTQDEFRTVLRQLRADAHLTELDLLVVLFLFNRRILKTDPRATGREILETLTSGGAAILSPAAMLHPGSALLAHELVVTNAVMPEDVFDAEFRLGNRAFSSLYRAFHRMPSPAAAAAGPTAIPPYATALDHLRDARRLVDLARRRSGRVFPHGLWADMHADEERPVAELHAEFGALRAIMHARETATPATVPLPIVALRREFDLHPDQELMVLALLFQELETARPLVEMGDLVRLVSLSEEDVLAHLALAAPTGTLRANGLVCFESETEGKDLIGSAWLPAWLCERLLGTPDLPTAIGSDERSQFHAYLEKLNGSADFFKDFFKSS